jgi:hypothetical protein
MEELDNELQREGASIPSRPLRMMDKFALHLGISTSFPLSKSAPTPDSYVGEDLLMRAFAWYRERYGNSLKVDFSPGSVALRLRGATWVLRIPMMFGTHAFICSPTAVSDDVPVGRYTGRIYRYNVLDAVIGLPQGLRATLTAAECQMVLNVFHLGVRALYALDGVRAQPYIREAQTDVDAAVGFLRDLKGHPGQSKWSSSQAAEKTLKSFLAIRKAPVPKHHKLAEIAAAAANNGLSPVPPKLLQSVATQASVRYGTPAITVTEATEAHHCSLVICEGVARQIARATSPGSSIDG